MRLSCRGSSSEWLCVWGQRSLGPPPASAVGSGEPRGREGVLGPAAPSTQAQASATSCELTVRASDGPQMSDHGAPTSKPPVLDGRQQPGGGRCLCSSIWGPRLSSRVARRWARSEPRPQRGHPRSRLFLPPLPPGSFLLLRFLCFLRRPQDTGAPRAHGSKGQRGEATAGSMTFPRGACWRARVCVCECVHAHAHTHTFAALFSVGTPNLYFAHT